MCDKVLCERAGRGGVSVGVTVCRSALHCSLGPLDRVSGTVIWIIPVVVLKSSSCASHVGNAIRTGVLVDDGEATSTGEHGGGVEIRHAARLGVTVPLRVHVEARGGLFWRRERGVRGVLQWYGRGKHKEVPRSTWGVHGTGCGRGCSAGGLPSPPFRL